MKRTVLFSLLGVAIFGVFFALVWLIVRIFAVDFPALGFAATGLSFAISLGLTGFVMHDVMEASEVAASGADSSSADASTQPRVDTTSEFEFPSRTQSPRGVMPSTAAAMGKAI